MLVWSDEFSVGDAEIDAQHRLFFTMLNDFDSAIRERRSEEVLQELVGFLADYARRHFFDEEAYMRQHSYPDVETHITIHAKFAIIVSDYQKRMTTEGVTVELALEISQMMTTWLTRHIVGVDQAFGAFVASGERRPLLMG